MAKMVRAKQTPVQIPTAIKTSSDCEWKKWKNESINDQIRMKAKRDLYLVERRDSSQHEAFADGKKRKQDYV